VSVAIARLGRGERLQGAGALVLFVSLFFLPWWGITTTTPDGTLGSSANGWHMFVDSRWLWLATIVGVAVHLVRRASGRPPAWSVPPAAVIGAAASLSSVLILYRILDHRGGSTGELLGFGYTASAGIKVGIWLALAGALAIVCGAYLELAGEGVRIDGVRSRVSAAVAPPAPARDDAAPPPQAGREAPPGG